MGRRVAQRLEEVADCMNKRMDFCRVSERVARRRGVVSLVVAVTLAVWPLASRAQEEVSAGAEEATPAEAQQVTPAEAQPIAREAYVYGFPIVTNYAAMYASAIDAASDQYQAPLNTIRHRSQVFTPADTAATTPNVDVLYSFLWMDLRAGPVVLGVPEIDDGRYYSVQLTDLTSYTFGYLGSRATGNGAGRYLIAGPNWSGEVPEGIDKVIRSETDFARAIYRTQLRGPDDLPAARDIQQQYTVEPLSELLGESSPEAEAPADLPKPASATEPSLEYFTTLNSLLPFCPPTTSEEELTSRMASIGVAAGAEFDPTTLSPEMQAALTAGLQEGVADVAAAAAKYKTAEVIGSREFLGDDYLKRAVAARLGTFANTKEEALYPLYLTDAEGQPLDASGADYVLKFAPDALPPVDGFWSLTMYDGQTNLLVANPINRYRISTSMLPDLVRGTDGSLTLYVQRQSPEGEQAANWLPAPDGPFYLVMRLYWPQPAAYDGSWTPPLVWRQDSAARVAAAKPEGAEAAEEVKAVAAAPEAKPEMERPTVWGEPTEVQVVIYVIDVDDLNSADQSFAASVYYAAQWRNPLLRHKGPGPMNRGLFDVWNPRLTIVSQQMAWKSYPESVEIEPDGLVTYRQKVWGRFSQPLKLHDFPFDQQTLSIHLVAAGLRENEVKLVPHVNEQGTSSKIAETFSLPDFDVVSWSADPLPYYAGGGEVGTAGYELKIVVARQATYYVLKVIIPLCLIVMMSWLPRWIDPAQTGTNIGISTSAFLTLVAYLFAITVMLPRVSYITRMDRFILISTLTVFAGLIQTVANTAFAAKQKEKLAQRADRWSRAVYPVILAVVLVVSFVL